MRAGEPSTVRMLASVSPVGENEVAAKPPGGVAVPKPSWTPSCWEMSPEISTIAASISTCGRRWSSCAISCARSDWTSARARTTTALMSGAGCTLMSSVAKEVTGGGTATVGSPATATATGMPTPSIPVSGISGSGCPSDSAIGLVAAACAPITPLRISASEAASANCRR